MSYHQKPTWPIVLSLFCQTIVIAYFFINSTQLSLNSFISIIYITGIITIALWFLYPKKPTASNSNNEQEHLEVQQEQSKSLVNGFTHLLKYCCTLWSQQLIQVQKQSENAVNALSSRFREITQNIESIISSAGMQLLNNTDYESNEK